MITEKDPAESTEPTTDAPRILVVDDETEISDMVATFLSTQGYAVQVAYDGDMALEKILTERPHVVILDVMMPGLSGWEICKYVRERRELAEVRIVMATGIGPTTNSATSSLYGADAALDKPYDLKVMAQVVQDLLP